MLYEVFLKYSESGGIRSTKELIRVKFYASKSVFNFLHYTNIVYKLLPSRSSCLFYCEHTN